MTKKDLDNVSELLKKGAADGVYPGAVLLIAVKGEVVFFKECGYLSLIPAKIPMKKETIFDLASLTKPLSTTLALMKLVSDEILDLDKPLFDIIPDPLNSDKKNLTPRLLLNHTAGFVDWSPFYKDIAAYKIEDRKKTLRRWILEAPLDYSPGEKCLYSDLGFMLLEWVIEILAGSTLKDYIEENFYKQLDLPRLFLNNGSVLNGINKNEIAATEACPWRNRVIQGDTHDENAYAVGGYSGHAGLFGTAENVLGLMNMLREHYFGLRNDYFKTGLVDLFFRKQEIVKNSTWALGWDTPSKEGSSSGKYLSANSIGHLGFTGTSLWMDLTRDLIVILLTNRIHPTRENLKIKEFRPAIHDLIMEELIIS
jgi:serine-type D-Ala-D-Ala carboxypeptidase